MRKILFESCTLLSRWNTKKSSNADCLVRMQIIWEAIHEQAFQRERERNLMRFMSNRCRSAIVYVLLWLKWMHRISLDIRCIAMFSMDDCLKGPQVVIGKWGNRCRTNKNGITWKLNERASERLANWPECAGNREGISMICVQWSV